MNTYLAVLIIVIVVAFELVTIAAFGSMWNGRFDLRRGAAFWVWLFTGAKANKGIGRKF